MKRRPGGPRRVILAVLCAAALGLAGAAGAAEGDAPIPPPQGFVTDAAGVIGEQRQAQLEAFLVQLRQKTGVQFAVLTVNSTAPEDPSQYKVRVVQDWHLGDEKHDEILLLLVAMEQRRIVFETGYGLEGTMTDTWESNMIRDLALPRFRAGSPEDGITAAVVASGRRIAAAKGVEVTWTGAALRYDGAEPRGRGMPPILIAFIVLIVLLSLMGRMGGPRGGWRSGGPWIGGGLGGWGGGFGGGGGGGGGGFGGFGGGGGGFSSGGGGGGGGW